MFQIDLTWLQVDWWLVILVIICVIAFVAVTVIWGIRAHRHQISAGQEDLIGKTAEVKVALEPKGVVFIEGEQWTAVLEVGRAEPGEEVIISKVDGLKLYVTKKQ
ncbi:NfeD family protein [Chloroflexota bacterium]